MLQYQIINYLQLLIIFCKLSLAKNYCKLLKERPIDVLDALLETHFENYKHHERHIQTFMRIIKQGKRVMHCPSKVCENTGFDVFKSKEVA